MQKVVEGVQRRGFVLVAVLLLLLAVTGVGHTLLVMTRSELFVSRARWDLLTRRLAAETCRDLPSRGLTDLHISRLKPRWPAPETRLQQIGVPWPPGVH